MNAVSLLPAIFAIAVSLAVLFILARFFQKHATPVRFMPIDGLRGYLAFFVFLHHASIYYFYLHGGVWGLPPSQLYSHFGSGSVCMFFMITAFLFFVRLIESNTQPIDWLKFFVARLMRLYPIYLVAFALMLVGVACLSHFKLQENATLVAKEICDWFVFGVFRTPNINGVNNTVGLFANVQWSLKYEWLFYLALPIFAFLFFKPKPPLVLPIVTSCIAALLFYYPPIDYMCIVSFSGGVLAAMLIKNERFCKLASSKAASLISIASLVVAVLYFPNANAPIALVLYSASFICIACGNTLFGVLTFSLSRELGKLSYGIYLMHGLFLYALIEFILDEKIAGNFSVIQYWTLIIALGGLITVVCFFLHQYIERPAIQSSSRMTTFLRRRVLFSKKQTAISKSPEN